MSDSPVPFLLDTHVWVRYLAGDPALKPSAVQTIDAARLQASVYVSVISIWEIALLVRKGRLDLSSGVSRWVDDALRLPGLNLLSFSPHIAIESVQLPDSLNKDPSDRILVATARIHGLTLITRDKDIIRFAKQTHLSLMRA